MNRIVYCQYIINAGVRKKFINCSLMIDTKPVIDKKAFQYILEYKYSSGGTTYLDDQMYPFWNMVERWIPRVRVSVQTLECVT